MDIFQSEVFKGMDKHKLDLLKSLQEKSKGKSTTEIMELYIKYQAEFSKGKPLTTQEKDAIIEVVKSNMTNEEKEKLSKLILTLKSMGKF